MSTMRIAGKTGARCGTACRCAGLEIWGPYAQQEEIARPFSRPARSSAWCPAAGPRLPLEHSGFGLDSSPLPAIYYGREAQAYRQWLGPDSYEATGSIGGSFVSDNIGTTTEFL